MSGTLYIVATPIGNLEDITLRALRILKECNLIACEDTRHTRKLLTHYQISKPTISYHAHNERDRSAELIRKIEAGLSIALVSDAGTPLISDPGFHLVQEAVARDITVVPVPGPSALIAALSASGLPTDEFLFAGFLPARVAARTARLKQFASIKSTLVFYEAPHRIKQTIEDARRIFGDRECVIARELTKLHEGFLRGSLLEIEIPDDQTRGEIVLLIGPSLSAEQPEQAAAHSICEQIQEIIRVEGVNEKDALKRAARARGISKSAAYRLMLEERKGLV
jgi:16S rRNA (cytidine1402-2'-O)-methyltransferase